MILSACRPTVGATEPGIPSSDAIAMDAMTQSVGAWHTGAALPVEIAEIAAASHGEFIYTGGGFTPPGAGIGVWFGRYDAENDRWARLADLPVAVHHFALAAADGRVWLSGGYTGQLSVSQATNRLDVYDPATGAWTRKADMPGRRGAHFMVALEGRLYVVSGVSDAPDQMWVYDIATDAWRTRPGAPTLREHLGAAASGGKVYAVAGRWQGRRLGVIEAYDPRTETWETLAPMPGVCGGCSAAATADGRVHVTGGEAGGGQTFRDHYVYDPATDAWTIAASMPTARHGIGAAAVGERFYVIAGGRTAGLAYSDLVEWWEPGGAPAPTATGGATAARTITATPAATATAPATSTPPVTRPTATAGSDPGRCPPGAEWCPIFVPLAAGEWAP